MSDRDLRPDSTNHIIRETCHARHPDPQHRGEECGQVLGYIPVPSERHDLQLAQVTKTGPQSVHEIRALSQMKTDLPLVVMRCSRRSCHKWNWLEIVEQDTPSPERTP